MIGGTVKVRPTSYTALAQLLSAGLDLCVRARKLDDLANLAVVASEITGTHCATGAIWVLDQYDRELAAWEEAARGALQLLSDAAPEGVATNPEGTREVPLGEAKVTTEPNTSQHLIDRGRVEP